MGGLLKELRQKNGFTQEQLSNKLHVSHQAISKWEHGLSEPSFGTLLELAEIYNVSITIFQCRVKR